MAKRNGVAKKPRKTAVVKERLVEMVPCEYRRWMRLAGRTTAADKRMLQRFTDKLAMFRGDITDGKHLQSQVIVGDRSMHPLGTKENPDEPERFLVDALAFHLAMFELWEPERQDEFRLVARHPAVKQLYRKLPDPAVQADGIYDSRALTLFCWMFPMQMDQYVLMPWIHPCTDRRDKPSLNVGYQVLTLDAYGIADLFDCFGALLDHAEEARGINGRTREVTDSQFARLRRTVELAFEEAERTPRRNALTWRLDQILKARRPWLPRMERIELVARLMAMVEGWKRPWDKVRCIEERLATMEKDLERLSKVPTRLHQEKPHSRADSDGSRLRLD